MRAQGVLFGQAVGDALGTTVEFQAPEAIEQRSRADGWPEVIVGQGPFGVATGQVTDDTELALTLARCLVAEGCYDDDAVARAYLQWRRSGPWDCGAATHQAFGASDEAIALAQQVLPGTVAEVVRRKASTKTQANGSLMRASPLGLFGHRLSRLDLAKLAARDATLSHPHEVCQAAGAVFVTTIADALTGHFDGPTLYDRAVTFASTTALTRPILDTLEEARRLAPAYDDERQGWVRMAFGHAFFHLANAKAFKPALEQVVQAGGDTDTNAAITGALLGAVFGVEGIPANWRASVTHCVPDRPRHFHCSDLAELAKSLVTL